MKKQHILKKLMLALALIGVCTSSLVTCAAAADVIDTGIPHETAVIESIEAAAAPVEEDILASNRLENYFAANNGGWATDAAADKVADGVLTITQGAALRTVTHDVDEADAYDIEFRLKVNNFGSETGFKYEYNKQRIMLYFKSDGIHVVGPDGSRTVEMKNVNEWHTYKFTVNDSQAMLYVDGEYKFTYILQPWNSGNGLLTFFIKGVSNTNPASMSVDNFKFSHAGASISVTSPINNATFVQGSKLYLKASAQGEAANVPYIDYYVNDTFIGRADKESNYSLEWRNLVPGAYVINAKYGDYTSIATNITVSSTAGSLVTLVEADSLKLGESTTARLKRVPGTLESVTYYANGSELPPAADTPNTAVYTADTVGRVIIQAVVTHTDGSIEFSSEAEVDVTADTAAGAVLQSSYIADYTASAGAAISASDGTFALDVKHSADSVSYTTADGAKTYPLGLGDYRITVDGGSAEVYYNGQYAFSFLMPLSTKQNGITASGVTGLKLSGINATRLTLNDGDAVFLPDFKQDYAVEWVLDNSKDFTLLMNDGVYDINLEAKNGRIIAQTYPNGTRGVVEEAELCSLPAGRHAYRLTVSNGISQLFIDNVWAASLRLPVNYSQRYAKISGIGTVYVRETADLYIHEDSFDGKTELGSEEYWRVFNEKIVASFENGAMTVAPNNDYEEPDNSLFYDSFDKSSSTWGGGSFVISDGYMTVNTDNASSAQTTSATVEASGNFEFEIKARVNSYGAETGIKLEYTNSRVMCYLSENTFRFLDSNGSGTNSSKAFNTDVTQWHTYKFVISDSGKKGEFFIDGESKGTFYTPVWGGTSTPRISVFAKAFEGRVANVEIDYVSYKILDVTDEGAEPVVNPAVPALIKAFAYNPAITANVRVDEAPEEGGAFYVALRYDNEYRNTLVGYNFNSGAWEIIETNNSKSRSIGSVPAEFPYGKDITLDVEVNGSQIALYVNGEREVSTNQANLAYYGNVGIATNGVKVTVSDFAYSGTGRAMPGAHTFINTASSPDVFEFSDGHIYVINGPNNAFESKDNGYTWEHVKLGKFSSNTIRLKSGTIVYTKRESEGNGNFVDYAYVSTDNGATFDGPFPIQNYLRNRITMNNKLTEGSTGRLFFASGESGDGVEGEGGIRVFYSDDEGRSWTGANMLALDGKTIISGGEEARMDAENTGVNCQESRVVELPDGTLRLYTRTDEGFLYYSVSTDNGETWTAEMWPSEFISVLSAFNIEYEPSTGYYYMAWEYNNKNDNRTFQYPRTRTGLAVSYDGMETWEYIGDIHEAAAKPNIFNHMNIGIKPTKDAIYVTTVYYPLQEDGSAPTRNYMVRVDKDTLKTTERFTKVHALSIAAPTDTEQNIIDTMLLIDADYANVYSGGRMYSVPTPTKGYIPVTIAANYVGAYSTAAQNTATVTFGQVEAVFTAGSAEVTVNGETKTISAAPIMNPDGLYVPVTVLSELYDKELTTSPSGATVAINELLGAIALIDASDLADYFPLGITGVLSGTASAPVVSTPSPWAAPEVNAALAESIVPVSLQSAYQSGITRAEFCELIMTMINKVNGVADSKALLTKLNVAYADNFTDTDNSDIICANLIGIVNGRGNGVFDPNAGITRQEAATMLSNAAKVLGISGGTAPEFTDLGTAGSWAVDAIKTIASISTKTGTPVMGGTGAGVFSPLGTYTREQSVVTVYRLFMSK